MYKQGFDPVSVSLGRAANFAALPLLTLFVLLGGLRMKAQWAALISLGVAMLVALIVYGMPVGQTLLSASEGASSGGVLGKMVSPQNPAIGAAAVGMAGQESDLFRKVRGWSILLVLVMCVLVYLQSTALLDWMVVE